MAGFLPEGLIHEITLHVIVQKFGILGTLRQFRLLCRNSFETVITSMAPRMRYPEERNLNRSPRSVYQRYYSPPVYIEACYGLLTFPEKYTLYS